MAPWERLWTFYPALRRKGWSQAAVDDGVEVVAQGFWVDGRKPRPSFGEESGRKWPATDWRLVGRRE
jgi:hypothetical protein